MAPLFIFNETLHMANQPEEEMAISRRKLLLAGDAPGIGRIGIGAATVAAAADFYRPQKLIDGVLTTQTDQLFQQRSN